MDKVIEYKFKIIEKISEKECSVNLRMKGKLNGIDLTIMDFIISTKNRYLS